MIVWLDHLIFGNGYGLGSPYFDMRFYWLSGEFYTFSGGLGAQLHSFQWTHPRAGERRRLSGREFVVFQSSRRWCRVTVSWALTRLSPDLDTAHKQIRELKNDLGERLP